MAMFDSAANPEPLEPLEAELDALAGSDTEPEPAAAAAAEYSEPIIVFDHVSICLRWPRRT